MNIIKKKIKKLQNIIIYHNYLYFFLEKPIITDFRYDYLFNKLKILEKKYFKNRDFNSPTQLIGSSFFNRPLLKNHLTPVLSLNNVFDKNSFIKFYNKIINYRQKESFINFFCELKFDGIALNLIYENGILKKALTRGDGELGEDVTKNVFFIKSIPLVLNSKNIPQIMEIRGEVLMLKKDFLSLNKKKSKTFNKFSNARNLVSGTLRHTNLNEFKMRKLFFVCHGFELFDYFKNIDSYYKILMEIKNFGFYINENFILCSSLNEIFDFYNKIKNFRSKLEFDIDGIVIKIDSLNFRKKIGNLSNFPKWAVAYKFPSEEKKTTLLNVSFQVGRTGIITPVAHFDSVKISGAIIRKASLYNNGELKKLNLYIGDTIFVSRMGDVIPKIIKKKISSKNIFLKKVKFPKKCPSCSIDLKISHDKKKYYCTNYLFCLEQIKKRLIHFFSKSSFQIKDLGPNIINQLVEKKNFYNPIDYFNLNKDILNDLKNVGNITLKNILSSLNKFKKISLEKFIFSCGIKGVGKINSTNLSNYFKSLHNLINSKEKDFLKVFGIGKETSKNLFLFFSKEQNKIIINNLVNKFKINIYKKKIKKINNFFYNKNILITGELKNFSRLEIVKELENFGAQIKNNFSKKINLVVKGKKPGKKLIQSIKFNIEIIDEEELLEKLYKIKN
ncbi:MAG: NAD-dependent DNA ligase LigA [Buchnera aphidicola (Periphyllus aceris)]|nr:NAD-dependent DNA ligase LigA [Buchnera aphidicola (Periphyllus aceris)]